MTIQERKEQVSRVQVLAIKLVRRYQEAAKMLQEAEAVAESLNLKINNVTGEVTEIDSNQN